MRAVHERPAAVSSGPTRRGGGAGPRGERARRAGVPDQGIRHRRRPRRRSSLVTTARAAPVPQRDEHPVRARRHHRVRAARARRDHGGRSAGTWTCPSGRCSGLSAYLSTNLFGPSPGHPHRRSCSSRASGIGLACGRGQRDPGGRPGRVPSLVVTLATLYIIRGIDILIVGGKEVVAGLAARRLPADPEGDGLRHPRPRHRDRGGDRRRRVLPAHLPLGPRPVRDRVQPGGGAAGRDAGRHAACSPRSASAAPSPASPGVLWGAQYGTINSDRGHRLRAAGGRRPWWSAASRSSAAAAPWSARRSARCCCPRSAPRSTCSASRRSGTRRSGASCCIARHRPRPDHHRAPRPTPLRNAEDPSCHEPSRTGPVARTAARPAPSAWETGLAVVVIAHPRHRLRRPRRDFLTGNNLFNLGLSNGEIAIMTLPMTLIIISGEIDLSVASILGHGQRAARRACGTSGWPMPAIFVVVALVGARGGRASTACSSPGSGCRRSR